MKKLSWIGAAASVAAMAGCGTPEQFASQPLTLQTPQGPVVCQLYRLDMVTWDRSIDRPVGMDVATADQLCRDEGYRLIRAGETD